MAHVLPRATFLTVETVFAEDQPDWPNNGQPIKTIEPAAELLRTDVENANITPRRHDVLDQVDGLKSDSTMKHALYATASGVNAADQAQAVATNESKILLSALGGRTLGWRVDLAGTGTAAAPLITIDPGLAEGDWVFAWDAVLLKGAWNRIDGIAALALTMLEALPNAPTANDIFYAGITIFSDEIAHDHTNARYTTLGWLLQGEHVDDVFELRGCKPTLSVEGVTMGEQVRYGLDYLASDWSDVQPTKQTIAGAPSGIAPVTVATGSATTVRMEDVGTALAAVDCRGTIDIDPGVTWGKVEGPCGTEGVKGYVSEITPMTITLRLDFSNHVGLVADYIAKTHKHLLIQVGDQPTDSWGLYCGDLEIMSMPQRIDEGSVTTTEITFRAHEDPAGGSGTTAADAQLRAPFVFLHAG